MSEISYDHYIMVSLGEKSTALSKTTQMRNYSAWVHPKKRGVGRGGNEALERISPPFFARVIKVTIFEMKKIYSRHPEVGHFPSPVKEFC